jgi:PAS domain S-box-containing protein
MISPAESSKSAQIKVLLVEDDQIDRLAFTRGVKQAGLPYEYTIASSLSEAFSILNDRIFEVAILDYNLGDGLSSELFPILREKNCPFIISTGSGDEETAARLMNEGASDYLIKDPDRNYLKVLSATVNKTLERHYNKSQLHLLNHAIQSIQDSIYILDANGNLQFINNTLASHSNIDLQDAIGQPISILKQSQLEEWIALNNSCPVIDKVLEGQIMMRNAHGAYFQALVSESCIYEGADFQRVGLIRDVTSLKQVEFDLRLAQEGLEQIVEVRTRQLQQAIVELRQENEERLKAEAELKELNATLEARVESRTQELQEREEQLRDFFDNATDLIQSVTPEGRFLFVNRVWKETLGYSEVDLENLSIFQIIHPEDLNHCQIAMQNLFAGEKCIGIETRFLTKDGRAILVEGNVNCQLKDGIPIATRGIFRDVTERKQAQKALEESQRLLQTVLDSFPLAVFWKDRQSVLLGCNQLFAQLTGVATPLEAIGKTDFDFSSTEEEALKYIKDDQAVMESGLSKIGIQETITSPNGQLNWIETNKIPLRDASGEVVGIVGTFQDITDRKLAEESLAESEAFNRQLVEEFPIGLASCRMDGQLVFVNTAFAKILGRTVEETLSLSYWDITPSKYAEQEAEQVQLIQTQGRYGSYEKEYIHKDGYLVPVLLSGLMILQNGEFLIWSSVQDISDRKKAEAQLQLANNELMRATRLKDEFLANMSHELRTPLNSILGMTEILQEEIFGSINEQQLKSLQTIENSSTHLLALINDILDVAKIESGQVTLDLSSTSIESLCKSSFSFIKQQALTKRIQLSLRVPKNLPEILLDERRIRQVLINLLNNAVKFTLEGGTIALEVSQVKLDEDTINAIAPIYLKIAVIDTGIGISAENIQKLFQPFIQIDSALNRQYTGTGLGLALVKRIVELHGGNVELTSELGVGSSFAIHLPLNTGSLNLEVQTVYTISEQSLLNQSQTDSLSSPPLILLAEDNEANIGTFSSYLNAKGYRLVFARNGQQAINLTKEHHPDLILMDIQMPVMDGLTAIKQIRLDPNLADIPIIALTALAMAGDREKCLDAGANEYLTKPVKLKELSTCIQQVLNAEKSND